MNETKYIVCYTEHDAEGTNVTCFTERFDNFTEAVGRYTLFCGAYKNSVVLADVENSKIIRQFGISNLNNITID